MMAILFNLGEVRETEALRRQMMESEFGRGMIAGMPDLLSTSHGRRFARSALAMPVTERPALNSIIEMAAMLGPMPQDNRAHYLELFTELVMHQEHAR